MTMFMGQLDAMQPDYQGSILDLSWHVRAGRVDFSYRRRGESQYGARNRFVTLWPPSRMLSGDPSVPMSGFVQDQNDRWSPYQRAARGNGTLKFIMGKCVDNAGTPVPNAIVQGFRTSNDQFLRETPADAFGNYEVGSEYLGENHYLVAYKAGSPDIFGTTVNTLQPTNRDGT